MKTFLKKIDTPFAPKAIGAYSQGIINPPYFFTSGQLPLDPLTGQLVKREIQIQINRVLDNLEAILKEGGCTFKDVIRCELFVLDLSEFSIINEEYAKRFTQDVPPVRQTIQVARLPLDALIEISCIALIPS